METALFPRVQHYLAHKDYDTAIFIAEQLVASCTQSRDILLQQQRPYQTSLSQLVSTLLASSSTSTPFPAPRSPLLHSSILLLAQCYYDSGTEGIPKAHHLLSSTLSQFTPPVFPSPAEPQHRYLLALSAFHSTPPLLPEAERALLPILTSPLFPSSPSAPSSLSLLATLCQRTGRSRDAIHYHQQALSLDPFLWSSVAALAQLGVNQKEMEAIDGGRWFRFQAGEVQALEGRVREEREKGREQVDAAVWTPAVAKVPMQTVLSSPAARSLASSLASATPASHLPLSSHNSPLPTLSSPHAVIKPKPRSSPVTSPPHTRSSSLSSPRPLVAGVKRVTVQQKLPFPSVKDRKVKDKKAEGGGHVRTRSVTGAGMSGKKKLSDVMEMEMGEGWTGEEEEDRKEGDKGEEMTEEEEQSDEPSDQLQRSADGISSLFRTLVSAYSALCQFHSTQCIDLLSSLPSSHSRTPFVLSSLARAHFEYLDYPTAISHFELYRTLYPHHLHSLDLYSTALWHLKKDSLLSALSHSLAPHSLTSITCVVLGNTFSLQRDHDTAIRFFRRAISLSPLYPYPHVLIGHELLAMEDFTGALTEYRRAIALDGRAYGGWYGVGSLLYQQEKWSGALYHFRQARRVNEGSGVLVVYEAMTLCQLGRVQEAERVLKERVSGGREDAQVLYQLAVVMTMKKEWEEALEWVERVEGLVWREASVWLLKGKILKRLGRWEEAMRALVVAMDLDPKDSNGVKQQLEKLLTRGGKKGPVDDDEDEKVDDEGY